MRRKKEKIVRVNINIWIQAYEHWGRYTKKNIGVNINMNMNFNMSTDYIHQKEENIGVNINMNMNLNIWALRYIHQQGPVLRRRGQVPVRCAQCLQCLRAGAWRARKSITEGKDRGLPAWLASRLAALDSKFATVLCTTQDLAKLCLQQWCVCVCVCVWWSCCLLFLPETNFVYL